MGTTFHGAPKPRFVATSADPREATAASVGARVASTCAHRSRGCGGDLSPPFSYSCPHQRFAVVSDPLASLRSSAMEPLKDPSNVTRLPGAEDIRLREPPHNFEAEQALLGAILINNAAYQRVAEFLRPEHFADPLHGKLYDSDRKSTRLN